METPCTLPPEIIHHILCFLGPLDVVRLRLVSRQFYNLTYDLTIWKALYASVCLPRPPGPFPSQSIEFLERTLVQSDRLAHAWTTQPMRDISTLAIPLLGSDLTSPIVLHGRWLVGCRSSTKFVAHDLDSDAASRSHQILWESALPIDDWDVNPLVSAGALLIVVVFRLATDAPLLPWKLLEFRVNGNSLYHSLSLDVPTKRSNETVWIEGGRSPYLYIIYQKVVFNAETRSFYELPESHSDLTLPRDPNVVLLTKTHVIALFHHSERTGSHTTLSTLIQTFTIPVDSRFAQSGTRALYLSHEGVLPGHIQSLDLIRNSIIDPTSGATNIRFLHQSFEGEDLYFSCISLVLPRHLSKDTVLPMIIELHNIAHVHHGPFSESLGHLSYVECSDDGYMRGFLRFAMRHGPSGDFRPFPIMRFTIDASQERCAAILGQISHPQWAEIHDPPWSRSICFDGIRGRIYYGTIRHILKLYYDHEAAVVVSVE